MDSLPPRSLGEEKHTTLEEKPQGLDKIKDPELGWEEKWQSLH